MRESRSIHTRRPAAVAVHGSPTTARPPRTVRAGLPLSGWLSVLLVAVVVAACVAVWLLAARGNRRPAPYGPRPGLTRRPPAAPAAIRQLRPGVPAEIRFPDPVSGELVADFRVVVPSGARSMLVAISGASGDCDIFARFGEPRWDLAEADHVADSADANEVLWFDTASLPPLQEGDWYVRVVALDSTIRESIVVSVAFDVPLPPRPTPPWAQRALEPGADVTVTFPDADRGTSAHLHFDVPEGTDSVLIEVLDAREDIDLYARFGRPADGSGDHAAESQEENEKLWIGTGSFPPLRPGRWYLRVMVWDADAATIRLRLTLNVPRPE